MQDAKDRVITVNTATIVNTVQHNHSRACTLCHGTLSLLLNDRKRHVSCNYVSQHVLIIFRWEFNYSDDICIEIISLDDHQFLKNVTYIRNLMWNIGKAENLKGKLNWYSTFEYF